MLKKVYIRATLALIVIVIGVLVTLALSSCSSTSQTAPEAGGAVAPTGNPTKPVPPTTLSAQVIGDTVAILLSDVTSKINTRLAVNTPEGQMSYMAYVWNGEVYVRAAICPPCGSRSFTLTRGTLVCNACGTVFDAVTGKGKSGTCRRYAKEDAPYQVSGYSILMKMSDLVAAYKNTLTPG